MLTGCEPEKTHIQSIYQEDGNRKLEELEAKLRHGDLFTIVIHPANAHVLNIIHNEFIH